MALLYKIILVALSYDYFAKRALSASCFEKNAKTCSIAEVISVGVFWMVEKFGMIVDV